MAQDANAAQRSVAGMAQSGTRRLRGPSVATRQLVTWMKRDALPFWSTKGWDARRGGFHERFFFDGTADDLVLRRTRVQWRQIYVLAHASELGWCDGLRLAFQGLERMIEKAWAPDSAPGFVHILAPDGSVAEGKRDAYDHAFAVLALSWLARTTGDAQVRALLDLVLAFCEEKLTDANGYLREAIPEEFPRRQNPHMHMLEAMIAAARVQPASMRVALVASSSWSHAFLVDKTWHLAPDTESDLRLYQLLTAGDYESWQATTSAQILDSGQQEILNWFCMTGAAAELGLDLTWSDLVLTDVFNSNKCFAIFEEGGQQ